MINLFKNCNGNLLTEQKKTNTTGAESTNITISGRSSGSSMKVYQYDNFNQLVQYNDGKAEATYTYNAGGLRASKTVNGVTTDFAWNGQNLAGETKDNITTSYTYDITGIISSKADNDTVMRFIKDPHGNVVATSKNGQIANTYEYTAFGNQRINDSTINNPFRYCGEYYDEESGNIYLRARYYSSSVGRFISEDPIKDGLNWYVYCGNNPVNAWDSSGLSYNKNILEIILDDISRIIGIKAEYNVLYVKHDSNEITDDEYYQQRSKLMDVSRENKEILMNHLAELDDGIGGLYWLCNNVVNGDNDTIENVSRLYPVVTHYMAFSTEDRSYDALERVYDSYDPNVLYYYRDAYNIFEEWTKGILSAYFYPYELPNSRIGSYDYSGKYGKKVAASALYIDPDE